MPTIGVKIRVFVPREVYRLPAFKNALIHTMSTKTQVELRKEFEKTVRTWNDKPNFKTEYYSGVRVTWVKVYTYSTKYRLVNAGAGPHLIRPRRQKILRFQTGFRAKSRPRVVGAFAGGKFGNYISARGVMHPGHEAREFDKTIAEEYAEIFQEDVQKAVDTGIAHG